MSGLIGASVPRRDAPAKVTGAARYTDDLVVESAWFSLTVRSTEAHRTPARDQPRPRRLVAGRRRAGTHIVKDE